MASQNVEIALEFTPNPNSLKYVVNQTLVPRGAYHFKRENKDDGSPLAQRLFGSLEGLLAVTIGRSFITITKSDIAEWDEIHSACQKLIQSHLAEGLEAVSPDFFKNESGSSDTSELAKKIQKILDDEIRPAVAMDGGDVVFDRFENGIVHLFMEGSCSGCPSSSLTLKMGIEARLKELIPEVQEVVAVQ
ncbi:MAG: NifU family protein [Oligoflexia bacterium]|nr:NifU family protein [Oligoflexia bacterium]